MKKIYLLLVGLLPWLSNAQPGSLDPDFGDQGKVIEVIGGNHVNATFVAVQDDQKILVCGGVEGPDFDPTALIYRYMPDGTPDESFGDLGHINIKHGDDDCYAKSVAQLPDGRIVVLVSIEGSTSESIALYMYEADGSPDFQFGQQGIALLTFGSTYLRGQAMIIQPDGKIVFAGYRGEEGSPVNWPMVARYWPDGEIDSDFGVNGVSQTTIGDDYSGITSIGLQPDGKIVIGGYCNIENVECFAMMRFTADGELDTSFDGDGKLITSFPTGDADINALVVQPDGKIVVAGYVQITNENNEIVVARYLPDGSFDLDFNNDGIAVLPFSPHRDQARSLILQPDGHLLLSGYVQNGATLSTLNCAVARLTPSGFPDVTFHEEGLAQYNFGHAAESINEIALQADGKIVAVGYVQEENFNRMLIARIESGITVANHDPLLLTLQHNVFPNPATAEIHVSYVLQVEDNIQINLVDGSGRLIETLLPRSARSTVHHEEILQLPINTMTGMYIIEVSGMYGGRITSSLLVEK
jgi:uncharacterized delta-60 repeat protein